MRETRFPKNFHMDIWKFLPKPAVLKRKNKKSLQQQVSTINFSALACGIFRKIFIEIFQIGL